MGGSSYLSDVNGIKMLVVNDKSFFIFGENCIIQALPSFKYMEKNVWDTQSRIHQL